MLYDIMIAEDSRLPAPCAQLRRVALADTFAGTKAFK
jgi:hypothetical protein